MKYLNPAACRFFEPADVIRWALAAYYGASRDIEPPAGEAWEIDGVAWSSPACFAYAVHHRFTEALNRAAIDARIPCDHGCASTGLGWDDSAFSAADFLGEKMNGLPPVQNPANNQSGAGADHG